MIDPVQIAQDRFTKGFNCSQSVFSAFASQLDIDNESALKLASPFGGGIAHQGNLCGAVTGALMVLGLLKGNVTPETKAETYHIAEVFLKRFREIHGTILCRELIGHDISTAEGMQNAREQNVFANACPIYVKDAAELVAEFLDG